ncbi:MAG: DNA-binding domain-containing protein [Thermodesulfobacteriota bacterium]
MSEALPLRELQLRLRTLIADPRGLAPEQRERLVAELPISGDARLSPAQRVAIYADMHRLRLRDALAEDYRALRRSLGDAAFARLVRTYLVRHPSDRPSLRDLGRHLPGFVEHHAELVEHAWQQDLARFEWAMVDSFDAADEPVLRAPELETLAPEAWPGLRLRPVRSLVLLGLGAPVDLVRERLLRGEESGDVPREPVRLRVWRQEWKVFHRRIDEIEAAALDWLREGATFADLCDWIADRDGDDRAAELALDLLRRWLDDELLAA